MKQFKLAICQLTPGYDRSENIIRASSMIKEAAVRGASLAVLPEMFYYPFEVQSLREAADEWEGTLDQLKEASVKEGIFLCTGSIACREGEHIYNRSFLIDPSGKELLSYSKCHLFDVDFRGLKVRESEVFTPGDRVEVANTSLGCIGILICYDIRFPEMARLSAMKGAEMLLVPAAFNNITGPAHWHITMRSRAVENQVFLAAISQGQNINSSYNAYGHSMVVSPWGDILVEGGSGDELLIADIDPELLEVARNRLPLWQHRRKDLYS